MSDKVYLRFERGMDDIVGPTFGPYDYIQLTYGELRIGTKLSEDFTLAQFIQQKDEWWISRAQFDHEITAGRVDFSSCTINEPQEVWYSDIVIYDFYEAKG